MRPASLLNTESLRDWSTIILATFSRSTLLGSAEKRNAVRTQPSLAPDCFEGAAQSKPWKAAKVCAGPSKVTLNGAEAVCGTGAHKNLLTFEGCFQQLLSLGVEGLYFVLFFARFPHDWFPPRTRVRAMDELVTVPGEGAHRA